MTLSLPHLWIVGHLAAIAGAGFVLLHLVQCSRLVLAACLTGGMLSCAFLAYILATIDQSFGGIYFVLAWIVAFLAGYATAAPLGYALIWALRVRQRRPAMHS